MDAAGAHLTAAPLEKDSVVDVMEAAIHCRESRTPNLSSDYSYVHLNRVLYRDLH